MLIHDLEKKTGLTRHTIRFYEKGGFLKNCIHRGENNYRDYSEEAITMLLKIKLYQTAGFTLTEIQKIVGTDESDKPTYQTKLAYIRQKMDEIEQRKAQLDSMQNCLACLAALFSAEKDGPFSSF